MEKNILDLISNMIEKVNSIEQNDDTKICLLHLCEDIKAGFESEAISYDTKFIENTIREFGYSLTDEVNRRCKKVIIWYSAVQKENEHLTDQLLDMELKNCLLRNDIDSIADSKVSKEMREAYEHMQKVKSGKLHYKEYIRNEDIARLYKDGNGATEIGNMLGCARQTVINRLKIIGLWRNRVYNL